MGDATTYASELEALRQMRDIELEARQGVWQWLIAVALVLLIIETLLASRRSLLGAAAGEPYAAREPTG